MHPELPRDPAGEPAEAPQPQSTSAPILLTPLQPAPIAPTAELPSPPRPSIRLEHKHPLAIRWMHWINFPVLITMIWSGFLIYWDDSDIPYQHPHEVYRIGLGPFTLLRFFPAWVYTNRLWDMRYHPWVGLGYHFFFLWLFAINGLCYVAFLAISGEWRYLVPTRHSFREAIDVILHDLGLRKRPLPERKFNAAQRIAYTAVILMGAGSLLTGLAIYKPAQAHWLTSLLGGYEMARWEHFWLTIGFCVFFLVHIAQVVRAGWNNFRSMISGSEIRPADAEPYTAERGVAVHNPAIPPIRSNV